MTEQNPQKNPLLPTLLATPRRPALLAGHDNTLEVLVRVQAPDAPADLPQRNPLNLSLVIDRSGSMSGQPLGGSHGAAPSSCSTACCPPTDSRSSSTTTRSTRWCPRCRSPTGAK